MKIAIVGSRKFPDPELVYQCVQNIYDHFGKDVVIVSGGCPNSPDVWAEEAAIMLDMAEPEIYLYENDKGKQGGFARNGKIVAPADLVIAFWDGKSHGTFDTIQKATKAKKPTDIRIRYAGK